MPIEAEIVSTGPTDAASSSSRIRSTQILASSAEVSGSITTNSSALARVVTSVARVKPSRMCATFFRTSSPMCRPLRAFNVRKPSTSTMATDSARP